MAMSHLYFNPEVCQLRDLSCSLCQLQYLLQSQPYTIIITFAKIYFIPLTILYKYGPLVSAIWILYDRGKIHFHIYEFFLSHIKFILHKPRVPICIIYYIVWTMTLVRPGEQQEWMHTIHIAFGFASDIMNFSSCI